MQLQWAVKLRVIVITLLLTVCVCVHVCVCVCRRIGWTVGVSPRVASCLRPNTYYQAHGEPAHEHTHTHTHTHMHMPYEQTQESIFCSVVCSVIYLQALYSVCVQDVQLLIYLFICVAGFKITGSDLESIVHFVLYRGSAREERFSMCHISCEMNRFYQHLK